MRELPDPGFADDDGSASGELTEALRAYDADPDTRHGATLEVLQRARLLVPVVAVPGEVGHDDRGLAHDRTSEMATVLTRGRDGRTALLAFTGSETMGRWSSEARPVPVTPSRAAAAALQDGADAIVVDMAGPVMFVVAGEDLRALAQGRRLVRLDGPEGGTDDQPTDTGGRPASSAATDRYGWVRPAR
jgi:hypothetical protein